MLNIAPVQTKPTPNPHINILSDILLIFTLFSSISMGIELETVLPILLMFEGILN